MSSNRRGIDIASAANPSSRIFRASSQAGLRSLQYAALPRSLAAGGVPRHCSFRDSPLFSPLSFQT